ncbi:MAG TPA: class I SAM-dependent methyltransferase [Terriglobales bacterium]|jgi:trans-aconitate methyltransferase|nr:class I SAM-dependent methyltransferase [Terriglobales bacterium]
MDSTAPSQVWNADRYAANAPFVPALGQPVLDLLNVQPGERILDLGCGDGVLTGKIVALGAEVVGVDSSHDMVQASKSRGLDARVANAYHLDFHREFDAVFSNAALHWMKDDPDAVIAGVSRALKPRGRFVGEMGGHGNVAAITVALLSTLERRSVVNPASLVPWYYPTVEEYRTKLEIGGLLVNYIELIPRPTPLPTGMTAWIETFAMPFIRSLPEEEHKPAIDEVVARLRPVLCDEKAQWTADYVRLRFMAELKE